MPLTKVKKAEKIEQLTKELEGSTSAIVGSFAKLTVLQDFELRKVVRGAGGRYRVLKNKLAARASKGTGVEAALQGLKGVSSVAYTSGDPVALAKALSTWVSDNAEFTFKLGIVDGKVISIEEIKQLATMPAKEEIYAKLLFLISSPAQRLVTVLNATGRDLAVVINQGVEKGKFAAPAVAAAPAAAVVEAPAAVVAAVEVAPVEVAAVDATPVEAVAAEAVPAVEAAVEAPAAEPGVAVAEGPAAVEAARAPESAVTEAAVPELAVSQEVEAVPEVEATPEVQAVAAGSEDPIEGTPPPVAEEVVTPEAAVDGEQAGS